MSNKPANKITSKDLIKNMSEFKEMYMVDYLRNTSQVGNDDMFIENELMSELKDKAFLEVCVSSVFIFLDKKIMFCPHL
jgi:hypothetical protein